MADLTAQQREALNKQQQRDWEDYLIKNNLEEKKGFTFGGYKRKDSAGTEYVYNNGEWQKLNADPYDPRKMDKKALRAQGYKPKEWRKLSYEERLKRAYQYGRDADMNKTLQQQAAGMAANGIGVQSAATGLSPGAPSPEQSAVFESLGLNDGQSRPAGQYVPTGPNAGPHSPRPSGRAYDWSTHDWDKDADYKRYVEQMQQNRRWRTDARRQYEDYYRVPGPGIMRRFADGVNTLISDENCKEVYAPDHLIAAINKRYF